MLGIYFFIQRGEYTEGLSVEGERGVAHAVRKLEQESAGGKKNGRGGNFCSPIQQLLFGGDLTAEIAKNTKRRNDENQTHALKHYSVFFVLSVVNLLFTSAIVFVTDPGDFMRLRIRRCLVGAGFVGIYPIEEWPPYVENVDV